MYVCTDSTPNNAVWKIIGGNVNISSGSNKINVNNDTNGNIIIDLTESNININNLSGLPSGDIVGTNDTQILTNKTIDASNNTIINITNNEIKADAAIDATKIANGLISNTEFQHLGGVTSNIQGQIDTHTNASNGHGVNGNIVGTSDTQILTNKTLVDSNTKIVNATNNTKRAVFKLDGADPNNTTTLNFIHTGNREITFPDTSDTLVSSHYTQSLTNKKLVHISNDIVANKLRSVDGGEITINNGSKPLPGQVLTATSETSAEWQNNLHTIDRKTIVINLTPMEAKAVSTNYMPVAYFPWLYARHQYYFNGIVIMNVKTIDTHISIRLYDSTNGVTLGERIVTTTGVISFGIINPTTDAQIELQIKKIVSAGEHPSICGALVEYYI